MAGMDGRWMGMMAGWHLLVVMTEKFDGGDVRDGNVAGEGRGWRGEN